jgi:Ca2+-binding RTX toxin-like protein
MTMACAAAGLAVAAPLALGGEARGKLVAGTDAVDRVVGTPRADVAALAGGNDLFRGRAGDDVVRAGLGDDRVFGGLGADRILGEGGADWIAAGAGPDEVSVGRGATVFGGTGADKVSVCVDASLCPPSATGTTTVLAGPGDDTVTVSPLAPARADGGPGTDTLVLLIEPLAITGGLDGLDLNLDDATGQASFGDDSPFTGFEKLTVKIDVPLSLT